MLTKKAKLAILDALGGASASDEGGDFKYARTDRYAQAAAEVRQERKHTRRALALLRRAEAEITAELDAAGPEEVRGHPVLSGKQRLCTVIATFLRAWEGK